MVFPIITLWELSVPIQTRVLSQFSLTAMMNQINDAQMKFDNDWQYWFKRNLSLEVLTHGGTQRHTDPRSTIIYYLQAHFGSLIILR